MVVSRGIFFTVLVALVSAWSASAYSLDVYFSGYAFLGDADAIQKNYPYSSALAKPIEGKPSTLDSAVASRLSNLANPTFSLVFERLGKLGPDSPSAVALAFALDRETVSVEKIAGVNKVLVELSAQALFFDFKEKAIVASFPVTVQYRTVTQQAPSSVELGALVGDLYTGNLGVNIFDEFAKTLASASFSTLVKRRIQVVDVSVGEGARPFLPSQYGSEEKNLKAAIAQDFGKYLSLNQRIPVLPYSTGYAIGNRMAARFSDGSVYSLSIPEPDYVVSLGLANLKKVEFAKNAGGSSFIYGAFLSVKAVEPLSNKTYFDATIKNGATKVVPTSQENVDDWPAFQESLLVLMDKFTKALSAPDSDWAEKYAGNKSVAGDMEKLEKVLQSCK